MVPFTRAERLGLWAVAITGLVGVNGAFVWAIVYRPGAMREMIANPIGLAFMVEAGVLVGLLAWLFRKLGLTRLGRGWFVLLSLVGSLVFAVPVALLNPRREE